MRVMQMHRDAVEQIDSACPNRLIEVGAADLGRGRAEGTRPWFP